MEVAADTQARSTIRFAPRALDTRALSTWALSLAVILYLGFNGGGYSLESHSQVGIAVWWIVVVCAAWGLLPVTKLSKPALGVIGLLGGFVVWTAIAITWSISPGRSFQDLTLVSCYLGILVLAVSIHRDRVDGVRHTIGAVATGIVIVAAIALAARLWPDLFPAARSSLRLFPHLRARLSWPLNYWNALASLMAVGLPLLLVLATSARTLKAQAAAAAAVPVVALCGALTLSRGGVAAGALAVLVFIALTPDRVTKIVTCLVAAAGSAILIVGAFDRHALQQALNTPSAHHQGWTLFFAILLVSGGVFVAQMGMGLAARHAEIPGFFKPPLPTARIYLGVGIVVVVLAALAAHVPHHIDHAWNDFKSPNSSVSQSSTGHFSSESGEGRYQYWVAAVDSAKRHPLTGSGPGTFQLDWLPRAKIDSYVENAHSLYVETYAELGVIGLVLLVGFFISSLILLVRQVLRSDHEERTRAAGMTAAVVAFMVYAAFDWVWQMPVIPAAILLLIAASLAPRSGTLLMPEESEKRAAPHWATQVTLVAVGLACLVGIAYPLAVNNAITSSQNAADVGNSASALQGARNAVRLEPSSAAAQIQLALVLETQKDYSEAVSAAQKAVKDEPQGWTNWLVLSRLYAEAGNSPAALTAYKQAHAMNPQSTLFKP